MSSELISSYSRTTVTTPREIEMAATSNNATSSITTTSSNHYEVDPDTAPILDHDDRNSLPELPPRDGYSSSDSPSVLLEAPTPNVNRILAYVTTGVLFFINLLNYMDRYTVSAVLISIKKDFNIDDMNVGLLQTVFVCSYMTLSPVFGYLGDRTSRKWIMVGGIVLWSAVTLGGSFCKNDQFPLFMILRACVGVGEASYSTIAPTIIADLFIDDERTNMLMIFYFAVPVGSGLGYIVGSEVAEAFHEWRYALRVTPGLGLLAVILIILCVREPKRGEAEGGTHLHSTSWLADIGQLVRNKSFISTSLGFTMVAFVAGALAFWAPTFVTYSIRIQGKSADESSVAWIFGIITCAAGFIGVALGSQMSRCFRRFNPRADPLVCAAGMLLCTPFLFLSIVFSQYNTNLTWVLIFLGETMLCLNWSIVADIVLYIVVPTRRSTAEAFQILLSHALGDAGSPFLVGAISDAVKGTKQGDTLQMYRSLQYGLYTTTFACVFGGAFFLLAACFVEKDKARVEMITQKSGPVIIEGAMSDGLYGPDSDTADENIPT